MSEDLFYENLIADYVGVDGYVRRDSLEGAVIERINSPTSRYVLLAAEPGAGKSGLMASLAHHHPEWLRYFIRRNSTTPLSGGDTASVFWHIGHQLAARRPALFHPDQLEVVVTQRVGTAGPGADIVGVRIEDLRVSPFHRTAIRVEQDIQSLGGRLAAIEVNQATVDPRLLAPETLQYLALLDPAALLAEAEPQARIVVLIDGIDEAKRSGGTTDILDWLKDGPELPPNVCFVLTSRPDPRLQLLRDHRSGQVEEIPLDQNSSEVRHDTRAFSRRLLTEPAVAATGRIGDADASAEDLSRAAAGNFAYLRAYERALRGAVSDGNTGLLDQLLTLQALPNDLAALYSVFMRNVREEITDLGTLDIERPMSAGDEVTRAWEGAGRRMLGVLAVARAPLTLDQLIRLGSIRVWRSAASDVLMRLVPFLDELSDGWQLFHSSLAEFLATEAATDAPDLGINGAEWHRRVVNVYRGSAASWAAVDWEAVDEYGLLHLAQHLAELGEEGRRETAGLVNTGLRAACLRRYLTDLPFKRIVETALTEQPPSADISEVLATTIFLDVVRAGLSISGRLLAPAVLGLMARLGRVDEARARAELMVPGEQRFLSFQAIVACAPTPDRPLLGDHDGADLLVSEALGTPATDDGIGKGYGYYHNKAIKQAAVALAPYDIERSLKLAAAAESSGQSDLRDAVLAAAADAASAADAAAPGLVPPLIADMQHGRAQCAARAAQRASGSERHTLLELAAQHVDEEQSPGRITVLAQLVAGWHLSYPDRAATAAARLRDAAEQEPGPEGTYPYQLEAIVEAARTVREADPGLAAWLLGRFRGDEPPAAQTALAEAARLWAAWGEPAKCREVAERVLTLVRGSRWYWPAPDLAELATVVDAIDPPWAQQLADEALRLVQDAAAAQNAHRAERRMIDVTIGNVVSAFRTWDPGRALSAARLISDSGVPVGNAPWDSIDTRPAALACLGLDAAGADRQQAEELLRECVSGQELTASPGRPDARLVRGGLFRPADDVVASPQPQEFGIRMVHFFPFARDRSTDWGSDRENRPFSSPAAIARGVQGSPGMADALSSWAGAVAAAVTPVAASDPEAAISLAGWLADPGERLIACAALVRALRTAGDPRATQALAALGRAAVNLPRYVSEIDLPWLSGASAGSYLNPAVRARWEAALLLPPQDVRIGEALCTAAGSNYLTQTLRAQRLWETMLAPAPPGMTGRDVAEAVTGNLKSVEPHPDALQVDLVRAAAVWTLAPRDRDLATSTVAQIENPGTTLLAHLYVTVHEVSDTTAFTHACRSLLRATARGVTAWHRAAAAATAARMISAIDAPAAQEIADLGIAALREAPPFEAIRGSAMLADAVGEPRRTELIRAALGRADEMTSEYRRRAEALSDLLGPAILTQNGSLVAAVAQRLLAAGWHVLMEGLLRGMETIVTTAGPEAVSRLDRALRAAQQVLVGQTAELPGHLDGVAAPPLRKDPLTAARQAAEAAPSIDLDTEALFLQADDIPGHLTRQEVPQGPILPPGDYAFAACDGVHVELRRWAGAGTISRLIDIRFVFPDAERAAAYHAERVLAASEGYPPIEEAPLVGEDCHVFGGTFPMKSGERDATIYFYVFRVRNVVVKLFAAQETDAAECLTTTHVQRIAERIVVRIEQSLRRTSGFAVTRGHIDGGTSLVIASSQPGKNCQRHPTAAFVA
jgi:hypothetical protein